jgi:hypothetical protein
MAEVVLRRVLESKARRSQGNHLPWHRMRRYIERWFPTPRVCYPYPLVRPDVITQGGNRMR